MSAMPDIHSMNPFVDTATAKLATWDEMSPEARTEAVRILAMFSGMTQLQIATRLGTTRNAVSGVARRAKISIGGGSSRNAFVKPRPVPHFKVLPLPPESTWAPIGEPVSIIDVKDGQCRWPVGADADRTCCGQPVARGSYCSTHGGKAFTSAPPVADKSLPVASVPQSKLNKRDYRTIVFAGKAQHFGDVE